jgi:hypothetical protein
MWLLSWRVFAGCSVLFFVASIGASVRAQSPLRSCGNDGEVACGVFERDLFNQTCDSGLQSRLEVCGCLFRGLFGNCLLPRLCTMCRNDTRHRPDTAHQFATSWAGWALRNQREQLAVDEPLNWVMHLGTHNAFNSFSDGHQPRLLDLDSLGILPTLASEIADAPNHFYSMTSQLDLGSRMLALDAHWVPGSARLCHSLYGYPEEHAAVDPLLRFLQQAICLNASFDFDGNPYPAMRYFANGIKEIRNWLERHPNEIVILNLENYVCGSATCNGDTDFINEPLKAYLGAWIYPPPGGPDRPLPSRAELLALGKRVILILNGNSAPEIAFSEGSIVFGAYKSWLRNNQDFETCSSAIDGVPERFGPAMATPEGFTVVVEDRTQQRWNISQTIQPQRFPYGGFGELSVEDMQKVARCNYTIVATDFLGSQLPLGRRFDLPDFSRHEALVWSWKPGERGQNGNCAMLEASSGRWVSTSCTQDRHYACAPRRSESGVADRSRWLPLEDRWKITQASGPWEGGPAACAAEFPFDLAEDTDYVFSVPVNGYQNARLLDANTGNTDLWLNYTDEAKEGSWVIPRLAEVNARPVADAGPDQTLACGIDAVLDGSASADADGDSLSYTWTGPFGTLTGPVVNAPLAAGVNVITLTVRDDKGGVDTDSVTITVSDTTPPSLFVALTPSVLASPNHQMVKVVADVRAQDICDARDVLIELRSIVSSEPENDTGDGNTAPDIEGADVGTGDLEFFLRAERSGRGSGRVYRVIYRATDKAGNTTETGADVVVPHDNRRLR